MADDINDKNNSQMLRTAKEAADILKIKVSTLRKYSSELEKNGYTFFKSERNHRAYSSDDITILYRLIGMKNTPGMTLERSAKSLIEGLQETGVAVTAIEDTPPQEAHSTAIALNEMKEYIQRQEAFNKELLERLDQQQKYMEKREEELKEEIKELKELPPSANKTWWKFWE